MPKNPSFPHKYSPGYTTTTTLTAYINVAPKTVDSSTTTPHISDAIPSGSGARPTAALAASWLGGAARGLLLRSQRARNAPPLVKLAAIAPRDISNRAPDPGDTEVHGRSVEDVIGGGVVDELVGTPAGSAALRTRRWR